MKKLLFLIALSPLSVQAGEYSDCILENMKGVNVKSAVSKVEKACREKALPYVPAKCKGLPPPPPTPTNLDFNEFEQYLASIEPRESKENCVDKCLNASYWSKHFGDCKE